MFKDLINEDAELEEACGESFGFSNVVMLRDFGPLKKGQRVESLWFHLEKGIVEVLNETGTTLNKFPFHLVAT